MCIIQNVFPYIYIFNKNTIILSHIFLIYFSSNVYYGHFSVSVIQFYIIIVRMKIITLYRYISIYFIIICCKKEGIVSFHCCEKYRSGHSYISIFVHCPIIPSYKIPRSKTIKSKGIYLKNNYLQYIFNLFIATCLIAHLIVLSKYDSCLNLVFRTFLIIYIYF